MRTEQEMHQKLAELKEQHSRDGDWWSHGACDILEWCLEDEPPAPVRDLRGWTEEENAEHQRRASIVFQKYVGQELNDSNLLMFKQDMLEEGVPVESVGIAVLDGEPSITVIFEHKPR